MSDAAKRNWGATLATYAHPRVVTFLFLGFSAGLPFLLVFSTLSAWMRQYGVSLTAIGFVSWIGITYSFKFVWSPVVDRVPLPLLTRWLGRRRSWMLLAQTGIGLGLLGMSFCDPRTDLFNLVVFALIVAFSSATQDIAMDAFRIEVTDESLQGATAATYQFGYGIAARLIAGAGALYMAEYASWPFAYRVMAGCALVGFLTTLIISEPERRVAAGTAEREGKIADFAAGLGPLPHWLRESLIFLYGAIVCPFVDFFVRYRWHGVTLLAFIGLFRLSDIAMGIMANPFYVDMGFTLQQIANVTKLYGFVMSMAGAFLGGVLVFRIGAPRLLAISVFLMATSNLLCVAGLCRQTRPHDPHDRDQRRQSGDRHVGHHLHRLPVEPHQRRLYGHAIRAVHVDHDPARQADFGLVGLDRRHVPGGALLDTQLRRLRGLLHLHRHTRHPGLRARQHRPAAFRKRNPSILTEGGEGERRLRGVDRAGEPACSGAGRGNEPAGASDLVVRPAGYRTVTPDVDNYPCASRA